MTTEIDARPAVLNLRLYKGDTFLRPMQFTDGDGVAIDITGWTLIAQIREAPGSDLVLKAFTVTVTTAADGEFDLILSAAQVADLPEGRLLSWDLQATVSTTVTTYIRGSLKVDPDVSRSS